MRFGALFARLGFRWRAGLQPGHDRDNLTGFSR